MELNIFIKCDSAVHSAAGENFLSGGPCDGHVIRIQTISTLHIHESYEQLYSFSYTCRVICVYQLYSKIS